DQKKFSQHGVDVISLTENALADIKMEKIFEQDLRVDQSLFVSMDYQSANRLRDLGYHDLAVPKILDFKKLLQTTDFAPRMKEILATLEAAYEYPVDVEYTANFIDNNSYRINLLQCRPLQTKGLGKPVRMPKAEEISEYLFKVKGNFMGGNIRFALDYIISIDPLGYKALTEQKKYALARQLGLINVAVKGKKVLLMGPGRWGTTTPSLGVPVRFAELSNMSVICELASPEAGFVPELSYGSHFFQDLVEAEIFYVAIFAGQEGVEYNPQWNRKGMNVLLEMVPSAHEFSEIIQVSIAEGMEIFSDIETQSCIVSQSLK
ncbi:MAG: pyruvate kinase, partial [Vallitaleaceae bacterium]|nr:pyruvate kinase [Vallitaleaceae bacterium]